MAFSSFRRLYIKICNIISKFLTWWLLLNEGHAICSFECDSYQHMGMHGVTEMAHNCLCCMGHAKGCCRLKIKSTRATPTTLEEIWHCSCSCRRACLHYRVSSFEASVYVHVCNMDPLTMLSFHLAKTTTRFPVTWNHAPLASSNHYGQRLVRGDLQAATLRNRIENWLTISGGLLELGLSTWLKGGGLKSTLEACQTLLFDKSF